MTKVWVERRENEPKTIEVSDDMTIAAFRARLSHRWPSDPRDVQPRAKWVATEVYKEGSMAGDNIDDTMTMGEAGVNENEQLEIIWRRDEAETEDEEARKEGEARKRHWRMGLPRYPAEKWHDAMQRQVHQGFVAGAYAHMKQRRQVATDVQRQEAAQRTLDKAQEREGWKERYETMRRGRNKTVMIGRQRGSQSAQLEGQMARLLIPPDKRGFCQVRTLVGSLQGRNHSVHIMDIVHPDVDREDEHVVVEISEATGFLANNVPHGMTFLTEAMQARVFYEQRGETISPTELAGTWKRWTDEATARAQSETSKEDTNTVTAWTGENQSDRSRSSKRSRGSESNSSSSGGEEEKGGGDSGEGGSGNSGHSRSGIAQGAANSADGNNPIVVDDPTKQQAQGGTTKEDDEGSRGRSQRSIAQVEASGGSGHSDHQAVDDSCRSSISRDSSNSSSSRSSNSNSSNSGSKGSSSSTSSSSTSSTSSSSSSSTSNIGVVEDPTGQQKPGGTTVGLRWRTPASCRGRTGAKKLLPPRERNKRKKEETKQEKMDREREATRRRKESADKFRLQRKPVPKRERERVEGGERRRRMKHTETAPHPKYKAAGPRGSGRGRARVEPAWMTNRADPNRPIGLPEKHTDRRVEGKIVQQDDDARATTDDDDGGTRRDDTTADNTKGDNDEGKAGRGLELELEVELDLELGRGHLQSHEKATTIGTVPTPSPTRGDTVVLTVPKAAAKPSKGEHRQRGPANGGYGSDSNDNMRLESRPASEAAVTSVVRPSKTEPPEETRQGRTGDARGGCAATRATNNTQGKAGNIGGKTVLDGATGGDRDGRTGVTRGGCADKGPSKSPTTKRKRKRKAKDRGRAFSDKAQKQYEERQRHKAGEGGSMS